MLQDHFHPPLSERRHWHSFHNSWATYLSSQLNELLPSGYFAEANVQFGIEIDVAAFDEHEFQKQPPGSFWQPPPPHSSHSITLGEPIVEIGIFSQSGGPTLAGAIELVSPANKDRPDNRAAFVSKCAAYIQQGIGLVIVDVVTERRANLHDELLTSLSTAEFQAGGHPLYAAAYRPVERDEQTQLAVWYEQLEIGRHLPTMPLCLRGNLCFPVHLQETYDRTCREQRLTAVSS